MFKYYSVISISFSLLSCGTHLKYLGKTTSPTQAVDVYVDASSIKKPYTIVGKAYIEAFMRYNIEKVQKKAVVLAKEKGADAILFQDYFVTENNATVYNISKTDSTGGHLTATKNSASPVVSSTQNILFLKYD